MKNILVYAPAYTLSGYGAHSRDIISALFHSDKFNISLQSCGWGANSKTENFDVQTKNVLDFCSHNQLNQGAAFIYVHIGIPSEFRKVGTYNVGITAGLEANVITKDWVDKSNLMDLLIVPTTFVRNVFANCGVTTPIMVVGEGVDTSIFNPTLSNKHLDFQESLSDAIKAPFNFLFMGQWGAPGMDRKNLERLIRIFCDTFKGQSDVGLVIKTHTHNLSSPDREFTYERIRQLREAEFPNVHLVFGDLDDQQLQILYTHPKINAFISLTAGEGWNRSAAEAIACDLPVMLPRWSGHLDFVSDRYSTLFNTSMVAVPPAYHRTSWFSPDAKWSMCDPIEVGKAMLNARDKNYAKMKHLAVEYGEIFREKWNKATTYQPLVDMLDEVEFAHTPNIFPINTF